MLSRLLPLMTALGLSLHGFLPHADESVWFGQLRTWLLAVQRHAPGTLDEPAETVARWPHEELQTVWWDAAQLLGQVRCREEGRDRCRFKVSLPDGKRSEWRRLNDREQTLFDSLIRDARQFRVNDLAERAAILHADIAMLSAVDSGGPFPPAWSAPASSPLPPQAVWPLASGTPLPTIPVQPAVVPSSILLRVDDGRPISVGVSSIHWQLARSLLDLVRPTPSHDETVRLWYQATAMYLQREGQLDPLHLEQAKRIFPDDPIILFLLGCLHESYAADDVQSVSKSTAMPTGMTAFVKSARLELGEAETYFRHAIETKPDFPEARLRHGRVLGLLGRHADALRELTLATASDDPLIVYYGQLFTGASEEVLGDLALARAAYARAAAAFPSAQSPYLALSHLAQREGDHASALHALQQAFQPGRRAVDQNDPWWLYHWAQGRDTQKRLTEVYMRFHAGNGS